MRKVTNCATCDTFQVSESESSRAFLTQTQGNVHAGGGQHTDNALTNHLLAALPAEEFARLEPDMERTSLALGEVIYESGEQLEYVYFPTTAIISLLYIMENGSTAEIGMTGNDGLVGIALFMGGSTTPNRAIVQSAGNAFRLPSKASAVRIWPGRHFPKVTSALHAVFDDADLSNRSLQPASFRRTTALPLASDQS